MQKNILFENNLVYPRILGCPTYGALILPIFEIQGSAVRFWVPYNDANSWECETRLLEHISFIPLNFKALFDIFGVEMPKNVPSHINYFHELQNWYYFVHEKIFIDIKNFDDNDGDVWINISKEFRKFCGVEENYQLLVEKESKEHP